MMSTTAETLFSIETPGEPPFAVGDALCANYRASVQVTFTDMTGKARLGIRCREESPAGGLFLCLSAKGAWQLYCGEVLLAAGQQTPGTHTLTLGAMGVYLFCAIDGLSLFEEKRSGQPLVRSGHIRLEGDGCRFSDLKVESVPLFVPRHRRLPIRFVGWQGEAGSISEFRFYGSGLLLLGEGTGELSLSLDDTLFTESTPIANAHAGEVCFAAEPLRKGWHTACIRLLSGHLHLTSAEVPDEGGIPPDPMTPAGKKAFLVTAGTAGAAAVAAVGATLFVVKKEKSKK